MRCLLAHESGSAPALKPCAEFCSGLDPPGSRAIDDEEAEDEDEGEDEDEEEDKDDEEEDSFELDRDLFLLLSRSRASSPSTEFIAPICRRTPPEWISMARRRQCCARSGTCGATTGANSGPGV